MKSASWIEPTDWMRAAPTRKVVDALRANGQEIRFVGGVHWPDFRRQHLYEAIAAYQQRQRRFGG